MKEYTIQYGDSLTEIAKKHMPEGVTVKEYIEAIKEVNQISNFREMRIGYVIKLP